MKNRIVFLVDPDTLSTACLQELCVKATLHEEAVFVLRRAGEAGRHRVSTGTLLAYMRSVLASSCQVPFYLLPLPLEERTGIGYWHKLKLLTPSFEVLCCGSLQEKEEAERILKCKAELIPPLYETEDAVASYVVPEVKRGLYITRGQPFHNGHAAFVRQIAAECEEVLVVIAAAELSHQALHPLTASERLEMIHAFLEQEIPGRYYLLALPQKAYTLENMYELEYLLPPFSAVYATNPVIVSMGHYLNYPVYALNRKVPVSSTEIRQRILNGEPVEDMVPPVIMQYLVNAGLKERLGFIHHEYQR